MSKQEAVTGEIVEVKGEIKAYDSFRAELVDMQKQNSVLVFDYATPKGQKEARSHVFKIRKSKAALDAARKEAKAEALALGRKIDSEAKDIEAVLVDMIDVHMVPIEAAEKAEQERVDAIASAIGDFETLSMAGDGFGNTYSAERLTKNMEQLVDIEIDERFAEFTEEAQAAKDRAVTTLAGLIGTVAKAEADALELARLREAEEKRQAEEKAKREAEEKAAHEEKIKAEAIAAERAAAEQREKDLIAAKEQAEKDAAEAVKRAEREKQEAVWAAERKAREEEAQRGRERAAAEAKAKTDADKKAANIKHQAKINNEAVACFMESDISESDAKHFVARIAQGKIKHVSITY